jgi:hypothetical protein
MKKIMYFLVGLLLISLVRADTNISIDVATPEDINIWANPNTPGITNYYLDGVDYKQSISDLYQHDMGINYVFSRLSDTFMTRNYRTKLWKFSNPNDFSTNSEYNFWWIMNNYFVPRTEFNQLVDYTNSLESRLNTIEEIVGLDKVLEKNKEFALENNLKKFIFRGKEYVMVGNDYVYIELRTVEQEEEINVSVEFVEDKQQSMVDNWQIMCDRGLIQFCKILKQRGY